MRQCFRSQCVLNLNKQYNISNVCGCLFHRVPDIVGDVLFSTKASSPYDLALVQLRDSVTEAVIPQMARSFNPGLISFLFSGDSRIVFLEQHLASYSVPKEIPVSLH